MSPSSGSNGKNLTRVIETNTDSQHHLVTFRLANQIYALPIEPIQQIIEMVTITPVPQVANTIEGVINFRGAAIPVVDLRHHLGITQMPLKLHTPIILVAINERPVGLIVDEVMDVLDCHANSVVQPRDILPDGLAETPLLSGLLRLDEKVIMLINVDHLFQAKQAQALAKAANNLPKELLGNDEDIPQTEASEKKTVPVKRTRKRAPTKRNLRVTEKVKQQNKKTPEEVAE